MNFSKNFSCIRYLLLFVVAGLMTTTLSAQTISQNTDESQATDEKRDDTIAKDTKDAEIKK